MSGSQKNGKPPTRLLQSLKVPPLPEQESVQFVASDLGPVFSPKRLFSLAGFSDLVAAYVENRKNQVPQLQDMFASWAKEFISTLPAAYLQLSGEFANLSVRLQYLERAWEAFSKAKIAEPYAEVMMERIDPEVNAYVLHFPLICQRKVIAALEHTEYHVYLDMVCIKPSLCFTHEELYHPNYNANDPKVKRYFTLLTEALIRSLQHVEPLDLLPELKEFISCIKSPYRDFFDSDRYFELVVSEGIRTSASIMEVCMAMTINDLKLEKEQVEGFNSPNKRFIPPTFTAAGLSFIVAQNARNESRLFFESLPLKLIEELSTAHLELFTSLTGQLALFIGKTDLRDCLRSIGKLGEAIWPARIEFPELQLEDTLYFQLFEKADAADAVDHSAPGATELRFSQIQTLAELLKTAREDAVRDISRASRLSNYVRGRKRLMPWEGEVLDQELAALELLVERSVVREKELDTRLAKVSQQLDVLEPIALPLMRQRIYNRDENRALAPFDQAFIDILETVERVLPTVYREFSGVSIQPDIIDPILAGNFDAPYHFGRLAEEVKVALSEYHEHEVRERYNHMPSLIDVVQIAQQFHEGTPAKKIRKKLPQHLVDTVFLREKHLKQGVSFEMLLKEFPSLSTLIIMIKGREQLQKDLARLSHELEGAYNAVLAEVQLSWDLEIITPLDRYLLSLRTFELVWDWFTESLNNPYSKLFNEVRDSESPSNSDTAQLLAKKKKAFRPWIERELALFLQEKNTELYELLIVTRPAAVYGLRTLIDINWNPKRQTFEMITALARKLSETSADCADEVVYEDFRKLIENVPSPFGAFKDFERYDFELTTQNLFFLTTPQECVFHSEARRAALDGWVTSQECVFLGNSETTGVLGMMVFRALERMDPLIHNKINSVAVNQDTDQLSAERSELTGELAEAVGTRRLLLQANIDELSKSIDELDIFRYFVREERKSMERGFV